MNTAPRSWLHAMPHTKNPRTPTDQRRDYPRRAGVVGNQVRFGIDAPTEINVVCEELLERITQVVLATPDHETGKTKMAYTGQEDPASATPQPRITCKRRRIQKATIIALGAACRTDFSTRHCYNDE
jgi:hypothetical protein